MKRQCFSEKDGGNYQKTEFITLAILFNSKMTADIISTSLKRKQLVRFRNYCLIFLAILLILFRSKTELSFSIGKAIFGENSSIICICLLFPTIILGLVFHFLSRRKKQIGKLTMTAEIITVQLSDKILNFNIKEIKDFKIRQGFSDVAKEAVVLLSSYDNWLSFEYNNLKYDYQFTIGSSYSSNQLTELLTLWKNNVNLFVVEEPK